MNSSLDDWEEGEGDLLSPLSETEYLQMLLRDLHDDLPGRITRLRYIGDQSRSLGPAGSVISGGMTSYNAYVEARSSFINGNFAATVVLCQAFAENLLGSFLSMGDEGLPDRLSFAETRRLCVDKGYLTSLDSEELRKLGNLRNPIAHYRHNRDPANVDRRAMSSGTQFEHVIERDAYFAIATVVRLLANAPFRV